MKESETVGGGEALEPETDKDGTDAREESKRNQFFEAAEPLFVRYGFRKTTIEEICHTAGASKRTFYELFSDKVDFAANLMLHVAMEMVEQWEQERAEGESALDSLNRFIDTYVRTGRERQIFSLMSTDQDLIVAFGSLATEMRFSPLVLTLRDVLDRGIANGEFRPMNTDTATWIIYTLLDSMYYLLPQITHMPGPFEDSALAQEVRSFILSSVTHVAYSADR